MLCTLYTKPTHTFAHVLDKMFISQKKTNHRTKIERGHPTGKTIHLYKLCVVTQQNERIKNHRKKTKDKKTSERK